MAEPDRPTTQTDLDSYHAIWADAESSLANLLGLSRLTPGRHPLGEEGLIHVGALWRCRIISTWDCMVLLAVARGTELPSCAQPQLTRQRGGVWILDHIRRDAPPAAGVFELTEDPVTAALREVCPCGPEEYGASRDGIAFDLTFATGGFRASLHFANPGDDRPDLVGLARALLLLTRTLAGGRSPADSPLAAAVRRLTGSNTFRDLTSVRSGRKPRVTGRV